MEIFFMKIIWCLIALQQGYGQDLAKSQASSYFYMKENGGYEYAFSTDTGMQSAQRADQCNEVTGHYMYYEKGVPFMVKYRAGINGYQPEIIPAEKLINENLNDRKKESYITPDNLIISPDLRTPAVRESPASNYRLSTTGLQEPKISSYNIESDPTLNFVQNALKTMQDQPIHMSFGSEVGRIQHPSGRLATTVKPPASTILQPITRNEVQQINNLPLLAPGTLSDSKHPYSFNYNGDQSARSETSDLAGNVVGSYSYYDEAGYHEITYKANDDTGFVVLGSNLAHNQLSSPTTHQTQRRQLFRNNNFNFNNYKIASDPRIAANPVDGERNLGKRSLRKFRRYAKW